ncbi:nicotinamide-nucleotide amidohydrolase family protein [Boseaceae bacterium BT-24-1]|nr:nicotinamide-nucleotide amidohydrolase family protein [Boseaceae bacterium BT-24-1]
MTQKQPVNEPNWRSRAVEVLPGASMPELALMAELLVGELTRAGLRLAVAESCTAGALANTISTVEGAGKVLYGGFVTYQAAAKTHLLGVPPATIEACSSVSLNVARAMALGIFERTEADLALSITGVTGPVEDDRGNPRGRVYIAAARRRAAHLDCHCEFGPFPTAVLLDAALRNGVLLARDALALDHRPSKHPPVVKGAESTESPD